MQKSAKTTEFFQGRSSGDRDRHGSINKLSAKCPICKEPAEQKYRPFCSSRCAEIDLGRWLKGQYWIAGSREETDIVD